MRNLLPVLLLASLGMAIQFGPAGVPLDWRDLNIEWLESSKFTSPGATSYLSMSSSAAADSLVWVQTQAAGDNDMVNKLVEDDGTIHAWMWNDGSSRWEFDAQVFVQGNLTSLLGTVSSNAGSSKVISIIAESSSGTIYTSNVIPVLIVDANNAGAGTNQLGETGDNDINYLNGRLRTNVTTVATATTMGASDGYMYTMTANDTLRCPTTPIAGEVLMCKFTHASGGWVKGMGNTIDGASEIAASENDNIRIVWNATASEWEVR